MIHGMGGTRGEPLRQLASEAVPMSILIASMPAAGAATTRSGQRRMCGERPMIEMLRRRPSLDRAAQRLGWSICGATPSRAGASRSVYITTGRENFQDKLPISVVW
jgi:hypothetical protein